MHTETDRRPFYAKGLWFKCTRCSNCCRHDPGYVFLSRKDIEQLKAATDLGESDLINQYCRIVEIGLFKRLSLKEKENFDCVFWENGGCTVYKHRPLQCRSYPFWSANISSRKTWEDLSISCPGINGDVYHGVAQIEKWLQLRLEEPLLSIS